MSKLPEYGTLRGQKILLATAEEELGQEDLEQVEVELEDGQTIRPWRFASSGSDVVVHEDGTYSI